MLIALPILMLTVITIVVIALKVKGIILKLFLIIACLGISFPVWGYFLGLVLGALTRK